MSDEQKNNPTWGDVAEEYRTMILNLPARDDWAMLSFRQFKENDTPLADAIKRIGAALLLILLCVLPARAQSTTTVTGSIKNLGTGTVSQGTFVRFWLAGTGGNQPRVNGTAIIAPTLGTQYYFDFPANSSGQISGTLYSTRDSTGLLGGAIEVGGSTTAVWYQMQIFLNGKGGPLTPIHAKAGATIDVSNVTPITTNPVITAPTGDSTYLRLDGGNSPVVSLGVTGALTAGSATVTGALTAGSILGTAGNQGLAVKEINVGSAFLTMGDSITACSGIVTPSTNCYVNRISNAKGWTLTNQGVSGDGIADMSPRVFGDTFSGSSISTLLCCVNDMRVAGINGSSATQDTWQRNVEAVLADMALPEANKCYGDAACVTYSGTWATAGSFLGGHLFKATANSSTATLSIYGTSVYVASVWQGSNSSTYKITIDGTDWGNASGTINVNGTVSTSLTTSTGSFTSNNGATFGPYLLRFSGLTQTTHTVILTCISCSAGNPAYFLFAGSATGAPTSTGPFLYVGNSLRFTSGGYSGSGGSDSFVDQFNQRLKEAAAELTFDGLHVDYVDVSGFYTPNGTNTQGDGVHPTDAGDAFVAQAFEYEMAGYQTPKVVAGSQWIRNLNLCVYRGSLGIGGCATGVGPGDITAAESPTKGIVFLGTDGSGIVRSASNYEFTWNSTMSPPILVQFNGTSSSFPAFKIGAIPPKITAVAADNSVDAAFEALSYSINGGTALTGQLGAGSNVMTDKAITMTLKKGSGGGSYTTASTTYVVMDSTNLCYTVTIPTGYKLSVQAQGVGTTATASVQFSVAITDNAACSTANSGIANEGVFSASTTSVNAGWALGYIINGDGASHNVALQFKTSNAADSAQIGNASSTLTPTMVFNLSPSN